MTGRCWVWVSLAETSKSVTSSRTWALIWQTPLRHLHEIFSVTCWVHPWSRNWDSLRLSCTNHKSGALRLCHTRAFLRNTMVRMPIVTLPHIYTHALYHRTRMLRYWRDCTLLFLFIWTVVTFVEIEWEPSLKTWWWTRGFITVDFLMQIIQLLPIDSCRCSRRHKSLFA